MSAAFATCERPSSLSSRLRLQNCRLLSLPQPFLSHISVDLRVRDCLEYTLSISAMTKANEPPAFPSGHFEYVNRPYRDKAWGFFYLLCLALVLAGGIYGISNWCVQDCPFIPVKSPVVLP